MVPPFSYACDPSSLGRRSTTRAYGATPWSSYLPPASSAEQHTLETLTPLDLDPQASVRQILGQRGALQHGLQLCYHRELPRKMLGSSPRRSLLAALWAWRVVSGRRYFVQQARTRPTALSRYIRLPTETYTGETFFRVRTTLPTTFPR